jgi:hypothetical protein
MAHSVSETAARAVKNSQKVVAEKRTPEQIIADIRKNLAAKLFVTPDDQRFLLAQYDAQQIVIMDLNAQLSAMAALQDEITNLREEAEHITTTSRTRVYDRAES